MEDKMSVSYLIALDKSLSKTDYLYKYILKSKKTVFFEDDGIVFSDKLYPQEQEIASNLFPQRKVYSIRSSVPLSYENLDRTSVSDDYYTCEKEQLSWFIHFLEKTISSEEDALFLKVNLGQPINYSKILAKQIDVADIVLPENEFTFNNHIYQFVNNKQYNKKM